MREIVVGPILTNQGVQTIQVWFRFSVPSGRQPYYTGVQPNYNPAAPGDYVSGDLAEINLFRTGQWVERAGFQDVIDPTSSLATIQTRLVNIYNAAQTAFVAADNSTLSRWDSSWDGTAWSMKSS